MKIAMLAVAAVAAMASPAFAQMNSSNGSSMSNSTMSSDSSMPSTCQGMMDKANGMAQPTDASKKAMAMKHMNMAKAAMAKGQEKTCMNEMKMAMHDMM